MLDSSENHRIAGSNDYVKVSDMSLEYVKGRKNNCCMNPLLVDSRVANLLRTISDTSIRTFR